MVLIPWLYQEALWVLMAPMIDLHTLAKALNAVVNRCKLQVKESSQHPELMYLVLSLLHARTMQVTAYVQYCVGKVGEASQCLFALARTFLYLTELLIFVHHIHQKGILFLAQITI